MRTIDFNINDHVWLKLTDLGRSCLPPGYLELLRPDAYGFVRMQMWEVMSIFGPHITLGMGTLLFETYIRIEVPDVPEQVTFARFPAEGNP